MKFPKYETQVSGTKPIHHYDITIIMQDCTKKPCHFWMAKNLLFGLMGMKIMDLKKSNDLNETWTMFIVNVLEKSIERREHPHLAKFWKLDCLQTEIKAIFDPTNNCTLGDYVQTYEEALKMASSCRLFKDFEIRIRLIDCLSYYDSLRFTRNR